MFTITPDPVHDASNSKPSLPLPSTIGTTTASTPPLAQRHRPLPRAPPVPASWLCSTCATAHDVFEILARKPVCGCGAPTLQAVYDQFGRLFLFWRDDEGIRDLRDEEKVAEAARRLWVAGGGRWVEETDVVRVREEEEEEENEGVGVEMM